MRKNHHGKKDRLVKRVFALCLALAVICTCLVPVFATEGLSDLQVEKELPGTSEEEAAGFGDDFPAVDDGEPREVYDDSEAAGFGEDEVATRPVEGGEDNLDGGPSVKETEWGTVIEYGPSSSTGTDPEPETQWSGEDDVVEKPDDKVVVSGDEIKKLQDMVVYRFWLKELNANDLQDITAQAQINNMTESEYLARNGEVLWNLYFIQAVPRAETIADYSSYIENPSSNRDPKGLLRLFDYWYTLDEFGNRVRLNLTDPYSLLYGHHMEESKMFGDLDLYKDVEFFAENTTGELILPDRTYDLQTFACLLVPSSESAIFQPQRWDSDLQGLYTFAQENALNLNTETLAAMKAAGDEAQVLALSTCSTEFTDARTILLAWMIPSASDS